MDLENAWTHFKNEISLQERFLSSCDEDKLEMSPKWAFWYADTVLNRPWPEAEGLIQSDPAVEDEYFWFKCRFKRDEIRKELAEKRKRLDVAPKVVENFKKSRKRFNDDDD